MDATKHIFVGRKTELEQFQQAIGKPGKLERMILGPGRGVKPRLFLPFGIGGIGKTELSKRCLKLAQDQGWKTMCVDWDRVGMRPVEPMQVMDAIAEALKETCGKGAIQEYLNTRNKAGPIRDRVLRYKGENPEVWSKMIAAVHKVGDRVPEAGIKVAAEAIAITMDYGPKALALLADKMVESKALKADEALLYKNADAQLAGLLVKALVISSKNQALVILLDTCEILSLALEEFLRDAIVCPAVEQGSALIFIVSGRFSQYRERQVEDSDGNRKSVKGYADRLSDPTPISWDLSTFADPEVSDYLRECNLDPRPELVAFVQQTARGVPFAVQLLAEALIKLGPERVQVEFPPQDPQNFDTAGIVQHIVQRFLRYCLDNPMDENRIYALALLRSRDDAVLRGVWQLLENEQPRQVLADLEARYGFIQPGGVLHDIVRDFLRQNLRFDARETAQRLGALAARHYQGLWQTETNGLPILAERLSENRWHSLTLDLLNALCWNDETGSFQFLAKRVIEALLFNTSFARGLLKSGREFRQARDWWSSRTCRRFDILVQSVEGQAQEQMTGLNALYHEGSEWGLEKEQLSMIQLSQARNLTHQGQWSQAMNLCMQIEPTLPQDESQRKALAQLYTSLGSEFGFKNGVAVASQEGKLAYQHAVQLDPTNPASHNGLGAMLAMLKETKSAQDRFTRAIQIDPNYATAYNNRGTTYDDLKGYPAALADYTQAIQLDPNYATAYYNRGVTYDDLQDYPAALDDFNKAIQLDPNYAKAYYNRGITYGHLKDYPAALADYTQAIQLDPNYATAYSNRGITYRHLKDYPAALADYTQALQLDPNYATAYSNRGNTYADLKDYPAALADYTQAIQLDPNYVSPVYNTACLYALQQEIEQAISWLRRALQMDLKYLDLARTDADFVAIRDSPAFQGLLQEFSESGQPGR